MGASPNADPPAGSALRTADLRSVNLNLLVVLDALLDERNVTRAAERVYLSQPATSSALNRLRGLFNDPLLVRVGNRLELTALAESLIQPLNDALYAVERVLVAVSSPATARHTRDLSPTGEARHSPGGTDGHLQALHRR